MQPVIIGDATLYLGDCMDVLPTLGRFDLVLTDPPYLLSNVGGHKGIYNDDSSNANKKLCGIQDGFDFDRFWAVISVMCKPFNAFIFCSNRQIPMMMQRGFDCGLMTTLLVWNKYNSIPFINGTWRQDAEFVIHFKEYGATFQGNTDTKSKVVSIPINASQYGHPTEKPIELIKRYVSICSNRGDTILDPFAGSGTTGVAAIQLGRKFTGIEREPKYFDIACKRIEQAYAQGQLFAPEQPKQIQEVLI